MDGAPFAMKCEDCGKSVKVPDDYPVDWVICRSCHDAAEEALHASRESMS